jgi:hypothetical protein
VKPSLIERMLLNMIAIATGLLLIWQLGRVIEILL